MSEASDARRPVVAAGDVERWDAEVDVVVVGAGGSALTAAVMAAEAGASVLVLEKAAEIGGTTAKSGGGVWVPLNRHMKALGIPDSREGALRYMARTSRPALYSPGASHMGLPEWEYEGLCLFVDEGATAFASLEDIGALAMAPVPDFPNYYTAVPEDVHKRGRGMSPVDDDGVPADGTEMIRQLSEALFRRGGSIRVEHRAVGAVVDGDRVVGVVARTPAGAAAFHAARGVVFGSGGFTHDPELRRAYLQGPVFGGCAAITNEGDFVPIAQELGAEMRNMTEAWCVPVILERALARDPDLHGTFNIVGDSMLCVNRHGRRVMNEKLLYNETGGPMRAFDAAHSEYPNMLLFAIFDQACLERFRGSVFDGGLMPMPGDDDRHVLHADTLAGLGAAIDARLAEIEHETGGVRLAPDFGERLAESVARFDELARSGHDDDFGRGDTVIERHMFRLAESAARIEAQRAASASPGDGRAGWATPVTDDVGVNPTMAPLAEEGPFHAVVLAPGTLDTKGGPRTDRHGRVLATGGRPVPGLYAVGNCAASPSAQGYWGAGATLGPMITYAWLAGRHVGVAERMAVTV